MRINLPTQLTLLRLFLIVPFVIFLLQPGFVARFIALLIFVIASITDLYDGRLARKLNVVTTFGIFLDPLADKLLISAALITFIQIREIYVPSWMVVLIIGREFLITGLRTLAVSVGRVLPAQRAGKFKTTSQITSIITILVILCVQSFLNDYFHISDASLEARGGWLAFFGQILEKAPYWLVALTTFFTILSGYIYLHENRDLFEQNA